MITEPDYILATTLAKARIALAVLSDMQIGILPEGASTPATKRAVLAAQGSIAQLTLDIEQVFEAAAATDIPDCARD